MSENHPSNGSLVGEESACSAGDPSSISGLGRPLEEGNGKTSLVFLAGKPHGQRVSLAGYSPWDYESQTRLSY